ncbi:MAG: WD40 repeat domain-containing protein [Anaerolineae bacterium]|jgi:WD40 repeat protein
MDGRSPSFTLPVVFVVVATALNACGPGTLVVGLEPTTLQSHDSPVESVVFSPDGRLLATGSRDGTVRVWRVGEGPSDFALLITRRISTGDMEARYSHDVSFSPDGNTLAFGLPDGSVRLWRLSRGRGGEDGLSDLEVVSLHTLRAGEDAICSLDFAPDGRTLAAGSGDASVHLWRVVDGTHVRSLKAHTNDVVSVAYSPDGEKLATASLDGATRLWEMATGTMIHERDGSAAATGVAFSLDGSLLAVTTSTGERQLLNGADLSLMRELESTGSGMGDIAFSPDGTMVAAGNAWYEVAWWNVADGALMTVERAHTDSVNSVAFSPDGETLASGSLDGTVKLWRVPSIR